MRPRIPRAVVLPTCERPQPTFFCSAMCDLRARQVPCLLDDSIAAKRADPMSRPDEPVLERIPEECCCSDAAGAFAAQGME